MSPISLLLHAFLLLPLASAFKYLHKGPTGAASFTMIKGHTLTAPILGASATSSRKLVDFSVELLKDTVVWDELEDDGARLSRCSRSPATRKASMTVSGRDIDPEDFKVGAAFVIGVDDWEPTCGTAVPVSGVDPADDTLFFKITSAIASAGGSAVTVDMDVISGAEVAPVVEIEVRDQPVAATIMPKRVVFGSQPFLPSIHTIDMAYNATLSTAVARPTIKHRKKLTIFKGATLDIDASLSANIRKFRVRRLFKTELQWEQHLDARVVAILEVEAHIKKTKTGEIIRKPIPKFGFSARIPFVGRARAGAFVIIDWVAELNVDAAFRARTELSYKRHEQVTARIIKPQYNAKNLLSNSGAKGKSSLTFKDETTVNVRAVGFVGVRPAVGLLLTLGKKGVEGNIGAKVGLELSAHIKTPPFAPYNGGGIKLGKCEKCHLGRAGLSLKGKDLSAQLKVNGKIKKNHVLVKNLFSVRVATVCAIPRTCDAPPKRSPNPKPDVCGRCKRSSDCRKGLVCRGKICKQGRKVGQACTGCTVCESGATCTTAPCRRSPSATVAGRVPSGGIVPLPGTTTCPKVCKKRETSGGITLRTSRPKPALTGRRTGGRPPVHALR